MGRPATGRIERRGPTTFRLRVKLDGQEVSRTFSTRDEARATLGDYLEAHRTQHLSARLRAQQTTLRQALERYRLERTPLKQSKRSETSTISILLEEEGQLCDRPLDSVATVDLGQLIERFQERGRSGSTINRYLAVVSNCYTVARAKWGFDRLENPVVPGLRCKENPPRERRLEPGEEARLLRGAEVYEQHPRCETRIKAAIQFAIATAMRQGEIGRVEWQHIQFQKSVVMVKRTKNGEPRNVPLWPSTVRMLLAMPRDREDGLVFGPGDALAHVFALVTERVGIEDLRFHDLRHEGTSRFFEDTDLTVMEIASITGHKTLTMLKRYTHLRADRLAVKLAAAERKIQLGPGVAMATRDEMADLAQTFAG